MRNHPWSEQFSFLQLKFEHMKQRGIFFSRCNWISYTERNILFKKIETNYRKSRSCMSCVQNFLLENYQLDRFSFRFHCLLLLTSWSLFFFLEAIQAKLRYLYPLKLKLDDPLLYTNALNFSLLVSMLRSMFLAFFALEI